MRYTGSGYTPIKGDEIRITIKPGERFIAAPPYSDFKQDTSWRVYLKSGIECRIDRSRISFIAGRAVDEVELRRKQKGMAKIAGQAGDAKR